MKSTALSVLAICAAIWGAVPARRPVRHRDRRRAAGVLAVGPGRAIAHISKRRSITNHIGTLHPIAIANLCELVAGTATEVSLPGSMRWIPRGMRIDYLAKAETDVRAEAQLPAIVAGESQDVVVPVDVTDSHGVRVVHPYITMYVSAKRPRGAVQ